MGRLAAITQHLLEKGAQLPFVTETDQFTEYTFRRLVPSVRVRQYKRGPIEILFAEEMCGGNDRDEFHRMPDMDWVLKTIDEHAKPQPNEASHKV
jgi:hypothetical protein